MKKADLKIVYKNKSEIIPYVNNSRTHSDKQVAQIAASIKEFGFTNPVLIDEDGGIIAGHGRLLAAEKLGIETVPTITLKGLTESQKKAYVIADNKLALNAGWDEDLLKLEIQTLNELDFDLNLLGFSSDELNDFMDVPSLNDNDYIKKGSLSEMFLAPPFSVLNSREGWWQDRKREWISKGINSGLGRDSGLQKSMNKLALKTGNSSAMTENGDSVFDPVLCELLYTWFTPKEAVILDPFAGGSVRGIVASELGRKYIGVDLRQEQVDENRKQAGEICDEENMPNWVCGDSLNIDRLCDGVKADFVFSCPPYVDLEVYSNNPNDLSNMEYPDFREAYFEIIKKACEKLNNNRFACFVVGEVRDKNGDYYNFVGDTIAAFINAGMQYYNEAILINCCGTLALRAKKPFDNSRKLGKTHQNVLIFLKGDAKEAAKYCGPVDVYIPNEED